MSARSGCRETLDLLADYLEGILPAVDRSELEAHFADCPGCLDFFESYRDTPRILREATAAAMPEEVRERLARFLARRKPPV